MQYNQSQSPYYDDYDPSKGYIQHLAVPERVEQAREFNQIQSISLDYISRVGSAMFKEGAVIEGCTLSINDKVATISSGKIFLDGLVRLVDGAVLNIDGLGTEYIGARIITDIVDEEQDASLVDPAVGYLNYNQPGAHRLRQRVEFAVNGEDATTIYTLVDGEILNEAEAEQADLITDTLARRTYDESGNFKVSGLDMMEKDGDPLGVIITSGKAYIQGYEVVKSTMTNLKFNKAEVLETINAEPKMFTIPSDLYEINYGPVSKILSIVAQVRVNEERVTRLAPSGGLDALKHTPVVSIDSVYKTEGDSSSIYVAGRDYTLSTDSVDWSLNIDGSIEPAIGSSYYVTYVYNKQLEEGVDYQLIKRDDNYYIKFLSSGSLPVAGTRASINYQIILSRRDLVLIDKNGEFSIIEGTSDRPDRLITPTNMDDSKLALGYLEIIPNATKVTYVNYKTVRLTQSQIYDLSRRIDDIEYNQAIDDLDNEAEIGEAATELKGIFTDGFIGVSKCDLSHPDFNCCIDYDLAELTLPLKSADASLSINEAASTIGCIGRVISAPFTHQLIFNQPYATGKMLVNPYAAYNPLAKLSLDPAIDNWIDTKLVKVYDTVNNTSHTTSRNTIRRGWGNRVSTSTTSQTTFTGTTTSTAVVRTVESSMIEYMRSLEIKIQGDAFESGEDNLTCTFNGSKVDLTPTGSTQAGTNAGTVRANELGSFSAKFKVPERTPCGSVEVKVSGAISSGTTVYKAEGQLLTTTEKTTTTITQNYNTLITTINQYWQSDPLAQSFVFEQDTILSQVGLFFSAKDATRPAVVQIRDMVNGYPGTTVYAETLVPSSQVQASSDSSAETLVEFNQPVYCKAGTFYCVVILSDCNSYEMFYAELAGRDILTNKYISSQPYTAGVMFSSSNSTTWTAHQTCDLKIKLYKCYYTGNGCIIFDNVSIAQFNRLMLAAEYLDYKNAGINWYYKYKLSDDAWSEWLNIDTYIERENDKLSDKLQLKADLHVAYQTSPMLAKDCVNLITFTDGAKATYISRSIFFTEPYTKLKIACQFYLPSNLTACGYNIYYSTNNGDSWIKVTVTPTISKVSEEFYEYLWELDTVEGGSANSYKIKIEFWTNNIFYRPRVRKLRSILKY